MTNAPTGDAAEPKTSPPVDPLDVAHPLSAFVCGALTTHFEGGVVATREVSQFDARGFLEKQDQAESTDAVTWQTRRWFTWDNERLVFASFDTSVDQNGALTPDDRRKLAEAGHLHGVVDSLQRLWKRRGRVDEPMYSVRAVAGLHEMALAGTDRHEWEATARLLEGVQAADDLATAWASLQPPDQDDSREPSQSQGVDAPGDVDPAGPSAPRTEDVDIVEPPTQSETGEPLEGEVASDDTDDDERDRS